MRILHHRQYQPQSHPRNIPDTQPPRARATVPRIHRWPSSPQQGSQARLTCDKDMDIKGDDLMPRVLGKKWPSPKAIAAAQRRAGVATDTLDDKLPTPLYVNATGKIALPPDDPVTDIVVALCHQGDHTHRTIQDTLVEFRRHFCLHGASRTREQAFIHARCKRCLSCIKTRTGKIIPRPLWYMIYATRPFEYIHMDFVKLPPSVHGYKYVLVITDDFSLTTLLHPAKTNDVDVVVKALLDEWLAHYPDPDLLHTDGGSHFDNAVMKEVARARGWRHTV